MRRILSHTWLLLNDQERKKFIWLAVADLLVSLADIISLAILLAIIQFYIQPADSSLQRFLGIALDRNDWWPVALFFLLFSCKNLAAFIVARKQFLFSADVSNRLSCQALYEYQHGSYKNFVQTDMSQHIRNIAFQPFEFAQYMLSGIQQLFTQACLVVITAAAIIWFNAQLFAVLLLILLPPAIFAFYFLRKKLARFKTEVLKENESTFRYLMDALRGWVEANIHFRNQYFMNRFMLHRKKFSRAMFTSLGWQHMPARLIEVFAVFGLFLLVLLAQWMGDDSSAFLTLGAFIAAAYKMIPGMVKIINTAGQMKAYESVLFSIQPAAMEETQQEGLAEDLQHIQLCDLHFSYGDMTVLKNFNLDIKRGDMVGIAGRSGIGKTSLLNILLGFLEPSEGRVMINGRTYHSENLKTLWPLITLMRQQSFLFHGTIRENIVFSEGKVDEGRLQEAIAGAGLKEMLDEFPGGLERVIAENGRDISGGQQQRICLARALYKNAPLMLFDEPFNELDTCSQKKILEHLKTKAAQGHIILVISHDPLTMEYCNKTINLDEN